MDDFDPGFIKPLCLVVPETGDGVDHGAVRPVHADGIWITVIFSCMRSSIVWGMPPTP